MHPHTTDATVDTSAVSADLRPVIDSLARLYNSCAVSADSPAKKREMEDKTNKLAHARTPVHPDTLTLTFLRTLTIPLAAKKGEMEDNTNKLAHPHTLVHPLILGPFYTLTPPQPHPHALLYPAAKKREMEDNTKKLGQLFWKMNAGEVQMTTTDWDACGFWLSVVKRLIKTRQTLG
eukprot:gene21381-28327_t